MFTTLAVLAVLLAILEMLAVLVAPAVLEVLVGFLPAVLDGVPKFQAAEGCMPCSPLVAMAIPQALPQPFPPL